jgi:ATP-dependent DNA helicase RecG
MLMPSVSKADPSDLKNWKGVGEALLEKLSRLAIYRVTDLFFHLPRSYQDRTKLVSFSDLFSPLWMGKEALIEGEILHAEIIPGRRRALVCHVIEPGKAGKSGKVIAFRFFYFNPGQLRQFEVGKIVRAYGQVRSGVNGGMGRSQIEMFHPEYKVFNPDQVPEIEALLTPVYPLTEGLTQARIRSLIHQAFEKVRLYPELLIEIVPQELFSQFSSQFVSLLEALNFVHFPPKSVNVEELLSGRHKAQQRLVMEELLAHRLSMEKIRSLKETIKAPALRYIGDLNRKLLDSLPFELTGAQRRVCLEIQKDLEKPRAMHRLLQGDVGSGKTLVALIAALQAIENGVQVAVMAPTEILAEQHYANFLKFLSGMEASSNPLNNSDELAQKIGFLSGSLTLKKKQESQRLIASGELKIVIGTQALFQEGVSFSRLGLVIIDEQHRFGVEQRQALLDKSMKGAHQLIMTATPIPRTLAMTSYADLNISVIDELPRGRQTIKTLLVNQGRRLEVIEKISGVVESGQQVYWVCTLIEESEVLESQAAEEIYQQLSLSLSPLKIGLVHGRMKTLEKQQVMESFKVGLIHILVATTVIEVGVDVPNATLMVIENPERLGLAQLHQLRGRVGRGEKESFCILLYQSPLSKIAVERLSSLRDLSSGFDIAEKDLELRGAGEVLGTRQTGDVEFKIADLIRDRDLLNTVKKMSDFLSKKYSKSPESMEKLQEALTQRWLGDRIKFQQV